MKDENKKEPVPVHDIDVGTAADVEAVMKKYDRESNVRIWEGKPLIFIRWLSVLFSIYCIYVTLFSTALPEVRLTNFLGMILILGYLNYPIKRESPGPTICRGMMLFSWWQVQRRFSILLSMRSRLSSWQPVLREIPSWW